MYEQFPQSQQNICKSPFTWDLGLDIRSSSTFQNKALICAGKVEWKQQSSGNLRMKGKKIIINLSTAEHAWLEFFSAGLQQNHRFKFSLWTPSSLQTINVTIDLCMPFIRQIFNLKKNGYANHWFFKLLKVFKKLKKGQQITCVNLDWLFFKNFCWRKLTVKASKVHWKCYVSGWSILKIFFSPFETWKCLISKAFGNLNLCIQI